MSLRTVQVEAQERFCDLTGSPLLDGDGWHVIMTKGKARREGDLSDEAADTLGLPESSAPRRGRSPKSTSTSEKKPGRPRGTPMSQETKDKIAATRRKTNAAKKRAAKKAEAAAEAPVEEKKPSARKTTRKKSARKAGGRLAKAEA